jgi:hypothetical protein
VNTALIDGKTDQQIVDAANRLAWKFAAADGWEYPQGFRFDQGGNSRILSCWELARIAFEDLTGTDINDAVASCEDDY